MFDELYQEIILDHASRPRNRGIVQEPDATVEADNPLCGDEITLTVKAGEGGTIAEVCFEGNACAICTASTSIMTLKCKGETFEAIRRLSETFQTMLREDSDAATRLPGDLKVLAGVRKFPMRVKCATLPWHAMDEAIRRVEQGGTASPVRLDVSKPEGTDRT